MISVGHLYNGVSFCHEKVWNADTCYSVDENIRPDTKGHNIFSDSVCMKCEKKANL
jgi:hypothetical protein